MPTVIIESFERPEIMSDENYEWLKQRLGTPLQVSTIDFTKGGKLFSLTISKGPRYSDGYIFILVYDISINCKIVHINGTYKQ